MFQFHFLLPEFTVLDNVMLPMRALGRLSADAHARARARRCSARSGSPTTCTSGPTSSPAASASASRSRARSPTIRRVILADEPTGSLDSKASEQVFEILRDLVDEHGKTVVAVTHDLDLAARMDRRIELRRRRDRGRRAHTRGCACGLIWRPSVTPFG